MVRAQTLSGTQARAQSYRQQCTHSTRVFLLSGNISPFQHELIKHLSSRDYPSAVSMQCAPVSCSVQKCLCTFFSDSLFTQRRLLSLSRSCSLTRSLSLSPAHALSLVSTPHSIDSATSVCLSNRASVTTENQPKHHSSCLIALLSYSVCHISHHSLTILSAYIDLCCHAFVSMRNNNKKRVHACDVR